MIRLADQPPVLCSACFNQQVDLRHVDFDASCDRGYGYDKDVATADGDVGRVLMDNLIVCENCTREAGEAIGMLAEPDVEVLRAENDQLKREAEEAKREARRQSDYAARLEDIFDSRPQPIKIDHRQKPRQVKELIDG